MSHVGIMTANLDSAMNFIAMYWDLRRPGAVVQMVAF